MGLRGWSESASLECAAGGLDQSPVGVSRRRGLQLSPLVGTGGPPSVRIGQWDLALQVAEGEIRTEDVGQLLSQPEGDSTDFDSLLLASPGESLGDASEAVGPVLHADGTRPCNRDGWFLVSLSEQGDGNAVPASSTTPTAGQTVVQQFPEERIAQLCTELRQAISPLFPAPWGREGLKKQRRPRKKRPPVSSPRRSVRLAKGDRGSKASRQQAVIIRKLCLANEGDVISDEALNAYVELFDKPLLDSHVQAILALLGWDASVLPMIVDDVEVVPAQ